MELPNQSLLESYGARALDFGVDLVAAVLLLIVGWILAGWAQRALRRSLERLPQADQTLVRVLSKIARYGILILVLVAVLAQFGVQTASILAVLGTAGLAIGLALQGTLSNIAAGMMLLFLRPFKVGDYIDAEGLSGTVEEIGLFTTTFTTLEGLYQSVPNANIWNRAIVNYSRLPTRRLELTLRLAYDDDVKAAMEALRSLLDDDPRVLQAPGPQVLLSQLAETSLDITLRCWTKAEDFGSFRFELNERAKESVEAAGCRFAVPRREVQLLSAESAGSAG